MNTQKKRFEYKPILCYLQALRVWVSKLFSTYPNRKAGGSEQKKDNRESEPTGDGMSFYEKFYPLVEKGLIDEDQFWYYCNLDALQRLGLLQTYFRSVLNVS